MSKRTSSMKLEEEFNNLKLKDQEDIKKQIRENSEELNELYKKYDKLKGASTDEDKDESAKKHIKEEMNKIVTYGKKMERATNRLVGFMKKKEAIEKIISYREKFQKTKESLVAEKSKNEQQLETEKPILIELNKKIAEFERLDNDEYSRRYSEIQDAMNHKDEIMSNQDQLLKRNNEINNKLANIDVAIDKCNLAWTQLFSNKSWDDIHVKATHGTFKPKVNVKENGENDPIKSTIAQTVRSIKESNKVKGLQNEKEGNNLPAKVEKIKWWKHPIKAFKNWRDNKKEKNNEDISNNQNTENSPRDAFLEKLQKMSDPNSIKPKTKAQGNQRAQERANTNHESR